MCSLSAYQNLVTPMEGQPSASELIGQFQSIISLLDTLRAHGTRDRHWFPLIQDLCFDHVTSLTELSDYDNAGYLHTCKSELQRLKETLHQLFVQYHGARRLNPVLRDVRSLAYGQAGTVEDVFRRPGFNAPHFTLLREYSNLLNHIAPAFRCGCFANASFNRVDHTTGRKLDSRRLAEALERRPGFQAPPLHSSLLFGAWSRIVSPLDVELVNDLRLVCRVLGLDFDDVAHQLVTYTVVHPEHLYNSNSPSRALRTANFELLAHHTVTSLRLLRQLEDAQESADGHGRVGNDVARAVVRTQAAWFERLWEDEHGTLRFTLTLLARDVQLRVEEREWERERGNWGRNLRLFDWATKVRWVDQTQDEGWVTWLQNSEDRDEDEDEDGDDGYESNDDNDNGDARPVQATDGRPRARRNAIVASLPRAPARTVFFVSAEHFVATRMFSHFVAAQRSLRAEPNAARAWLLDGTPSPPAEYEHPTHAYLWGTLRALFAHVVATGLSPSLRRELQRLADLAVAAWEEPVLLPEYFTERPNTLHLADTVPGLQWLAVLFAATDRLGAAQATFLADRLYPHIVVADLEAANLAAGAAHPALGFSPGRCSRSLARWRTLDLPCWVAHLRLLAAPLAQPDDSALLAAYDAEYSAVAAAATRDQHAALLSALPLSLHPVNLECPDTLTHANANPQYSFLLELLSALRREHDELCRSDPHGARVAVLDAQRQTYGTALLDIVKASRSKSPEFGPVTDAEAVPFLFALPGGADVLRPFTALAEPVAVVDREANDVVMEMENLEANDVVMEMEDLEAEDLEAEDLEAEDSEAEDLEAEDLEAEDLEAEDLEAEDLEAEDLEAEDLEAEDLDMEAEDLEAEDLDMESEDSGCESAGTRALR